MLQTFLLKRKFHLFSLAGCTLSRAALFPGSEVGCPCWCSVECHTDHSKAGKSRFFFNQLFGSQNISFSHSMPEKLFRRDFFIRKSFWRLVVTEALFMNVLCFISVLKSIENPDWKIWECRSLLPQFTFGAVRELQLMFLSALKKRENLSSSLFSVSNEKKWSERFLNASEETYLLKQMDRGGLAKLGRVSS